MEKLGILSVLMSHKFFMDNKDHLLETMFPEKVGVLFKTIKSMHEKYKRDITLDEVRDILFGENPSLTRAQRAEYLSLLEDVKDKGNIGPDAGADILRFMWRQEIGREIAAKGIDISEGKASLNDIEDIVKKVQADFTPTDDVAPITTDVDEVLSALDTRSQWQFNIPDLAKKIPGISPGEFAILFARPELGKTAAWVNLVFGLEGFLTQGAKVLVVCNEEPAIRTMMRGICSYTGLTRDEVRTNKDKVREIFKEVSDRIRMIDDIDMSIPRLNGIVRKHKPDVVVIDQLDKVFVGGSFARPDEFLGEVYIGAREIAKRHNAAVFGISQASAEAEGKTQVHYSMLAGSKTSKAAEADLIIGIGKSGEDISDPTRSWFVSKNKISGWHGLVHTILQGEVSRYK